MTIAIGNFIINFIVGVFIGIALGAGTAYIFMCERRDDAKD